LLDPQYVRVLLDKITERTSPISRFTEFPIRHLEQTILQDGNCHAPPVGFAGLTRAVEGCLD
jgi:hypothetical protein